MLLRNCQPNVNDYVSKFFSEVRKTNGSVYPPPTLNYMLHLINMARELNCGIKIYEDEEFSRLRCYVNDELKNKSTANGYQQPKVQAEIITENMEEKLFEKKVLGDHNPDFI